MSNSYEKAHPFEKRSKDSENIRKRYPDRIPVVVLQDKKDSLPKLNRSKYLVPMDLTLGQFIYVLRKRLVLQGSDALFVYINNTLVPTSHAMEQIFNEHRSSDGFLYLTIAGENAFGSI